MTDAVIIIIIVLISTVICPAGGIVFACAIVHGKKAKASAILLGRKKETILQGLLKPDSLLAQAVKNLSAVLEIWVQSLGQKDPLEKGMATHLLRYSFLGNPMDRGSWWATVLGVAESDTTEYTRTHGLRQYGLGPDIDKTNGTGEQVPKVLVYANANASDTKKFQMFSMFINEEFKGNI